MRAVRRYIPRLEQELELLKVQTGNKEDHALEKAENDIGSPALPVSESAPSDKLRELMEQYDRTIEGDDPFSDASMNSDSEDLSDMFETDSDSAENVECSLYLNEFDKIPAKNSDPEKFVEDLCQMSLDSKKDELTSENADMADFDEIDQVFLQAAELLKKKKRR